jgi:AcrR family transcriptional regulator
VTRRAARGHGASRRAEGGAASRGRAAPSHGRAGWPREPRAEDAADRILDAAEKAFVEVGVSRAGMAEIAEAAGCSRGTLYRYFPSRHALHLAYVNREARAIVARVRTALAGVSDPRERAVGFVLRTLREVRSNPGTAAWFEPGASGMAARMSRASEVIERLAGTFSDGWLDGDGPATAARAAAADASLRARWLVRVIVSLLADPEEDEAHERALIERFVAPVLLDDAER